MARKQIKCCDCGFLGVHYRLGELSDTFSDIQELEPQARLDVIEWLKDKDAFLGCFREQGYLLAGITSPSSGVPVSDFHKAVKEPRKCRYYHPYNPSYTPKQHLDLQREREQRQFLIVVSILSAAVGAALATLVHLVLQAV